MDLEDPNKDETTWKLEGTLKRARELSSRNLVEKLAKSLTQPRVKALGQHRVKDLSWYRVITKASSTGRRRLKRNQNDLKFNKST